MKKIDVSTEVFALIWAQRAVGEENEDAILRRILNSIIDRKAIEADLPEGIGGIFEKRFGVHFEEGFKLERVYKGKKFLARVSSGQWIIDGLAGRFFTLNELSRAIGTKTENAWMNWNYLDERGQKRPVSDLRMPDKVKKKYRNQSYKGPAKEAPPTSGKSSRWCDDVRFALEILGGTAHLSKIYDQVKKIRSSMGRSTPKSLEEVVRKELEMRSSDSEVFDEERGEDWFAMPEGKGKGVWSLRRT